MEGRINRGRLGRAFSPSPAQYGHGDGGSACREKSPRGLVGGCARRQDVIHQQNATPVEIGMKSPRYVKRAFKIRASPARRKLGLFVRPASFRKYMGRQIDSQAAQQHGRQRLRRWGLVRTFSVQ